MLLKCCLLASHSFLKEEMPSEIKYYIMEQSLLVLLSQVTSLSADQQVGDIITVFDLEFNPITS